MRRAIRILQWTSNNTEILRHLWAEGVSGSEIAERLGTTKNAVIGKAHRMRLERRENPITKITPDLRHTAKRAPRQTLPSLISPQLHASIGGLRIPKHTLPAMGPIPVHVETHARKRHRDGSGCSFILGQPSGIHTLFCDADLDSGSSYCAEHRALCFTAVREVNTWVRGQVQGGD